MSDATLSPAGTRPLLEFLPVSLFGSVMGLTGLSVAWRIAHATYGIPEWPALLLAALAVTDFVVLSVAYLLKLATATATVRTEFSHPIVGSLFGTILISLLLLPLVLAPFSLLLARVLWGVGAAGMLLFAWLMVSRWMSERQQNAHATPTWIIPVVGLLDVPLAIPTLGLTELHGLMVFALAVGLFFAVPLFTMIFSRLLFEAPMPDALKPTLLILVAPFAVGYSAYVVTTGQNDLFAEALYMLTLFILLILLGQLRYLPRCCPFRVSWWAVSFPLAASSIATLRYATANPGWLTYAVAWGILALATTIILALLGRTLFGLAKGELRTLSS
jgi:tellurite resistance protein